MTATAPEANSELILRISLHVLEHLGINLYSNIPSVLSEVVANAWDADATIVNITVNNENRTITIEDNGIGMTQREVQDRFLTVGYQRRKHQQGLTDRHERKPMGRKGIGKLSLFSIANTIEVYTSKIAPNSKDERKTAFRMDIGKIRDQIEQESEGIGACPVEKLPTTDLNIQEGTRIVLSNMKRSRMHIKSLKKHLARRFSIIGEKNNFQINVGGETITPSDRGYFTSLRHLWVFRDNEDEELRKMCTNLDSRNGFTQNPCMEKGDLRVTGWIGAVQSVSQLKDEGPEGENLNRIAIFSRGKMMQEDILRNFGKRGIFSNYLVGELDVDGLDEYDGTGEPDSDAATTSRQNIVEHDPRYIDLRDLIGAEVTKIGTSWLDWRGERALNLARSIPAVQDWLKALPKDHKRKATAWLTKIGNIQGDDQEDQKRLIKHAIIAFEFYKSNQILDQLDRLDIKGLDMAIELFNTSDQFQKFLYGQIVKNRIHVINTLEKKCNENQLERAIQDHIYDHLWLIDPSWERAESSAYMEKSINKAFSDVDGGLSKEQLNSRLDIKYRLITGKHVIVELKRPERIISFYSDLLPQIEKYARAIQLLLHKSNDAVKSFEIVCILGKALKEENIPGGNDRIQDTLKTHNARVVYYETLLGQASRIYQEYLEASKDTDRLMKIIDGIDDFILDSDGLS